MREIKTHWADYKQELKDERNIGQYMFFSLDVQELKSTLVYRSRGKEYYLVKFNLKKSCIYDS